MRLLERLPRETGREYALRTIKENIIHLDLAPGSYISENELSAELGLSRTPVREALIELAKMKVVEISPQKRSVVSLINYALVEESQFMRDVLECAVVKQVCAVASSEDIARLDENLRLQEFYLARGDTDTLMDLDNKFHMALFVIAQKRQVYDLMQTLAIHFDRVRSMALSSVKELKIVDDHRIILDAIIAGDSVTASTVMGEHLNRYKVDAALILEKYPQFFRTE